MNGTQGHYIYDSIIPIDTKMILMVARTELEILTTGASQAYLFKTYEPIILLSLVEEFVADFYLNTKRLRNVDINNLAWMPRYTNSVVSTIESDVYANIDDTIKDEPNIGADLLYMVSEEWDSTSSMLYSLIHTRARELLYPIYNYLATYLKMGVCLQFVSARVTNEVSIELTFRVINGTLMETKLMHLGEAYDVAARSYGSSSNRMASAIAGTGVHGLL